MISRPEGITVPTSDAGIETLKQVSLFAGLSDKEIGQVLAAGDEIEFPAGATIVKVGDRASDFYVLLSGSARIDMPGKEAVALGPGDYFGEMSVLDGQPRSATIVADGHVLAVRINRQALFALLDEHGSLGRKILVEMSRRVRAAEGTRADH